MIAPYLTQKFQLYLVRPTVIIMSFASYALTEIAHSAAETDQKRFVMEFRRADGFVLRVELVIGRPEDEGRSPMEVLEKQVGPKWSNFAPGSVYRFDPRSKPPAWNLS